MDNRTLLLLEKFFECQGRGLILILNKKKGKMNKMNRLELEKIIIEEGKKRGIKVTKCNIYDRGKDGLQFFPTIDNVNKSEWIYEDQVKELIDDLAPLERPHEVADINLDYISRYFKIGEEIELDNIWIRLDAEEEEQSNLITYGSVCGQYRQGWVTGKIVETPEQNDRCLAIKFDRDIFLEKEHKWWGDVSKLEQAIKDGKIVKVEKGQPVYCGTCRWDIRKKK